MRTRKGQALPWWLRTVASRAEISKKRSRRLWSRSCKQEARSQNVVVVSKRGPSLLSASVLLCHGSHQHAVRLACRVSNYGMLLQTKAKTIRKTPTNLFAVRSQHRWWVVHRCPTMEVVLLPGRWGILFFVSRPSPNPNPWWLVQSCVLNRPRTYSTSGSQFFFVFEFLGW